MSKAAPPPPDLVVLSADKNIEAVVSTLLEKRAAALQLRAMQTRFITHPQRDPGCLNNSRGVLDPFRATHRHALVVFDREGCGRETDSREALEAAVEADLAKAGWDDRAAAVVIDPELERWVWSPSPHVATALGWSEERGELCDWLVAEKWLDDRAQPKPKRPKEAAEAVLRLVQKPRSSSVYQAIAAKVSVQLCTDPAFIKLRDRMQQWFPRSHGGA